MRILITGATGYVGGFIVDELLAAGHQVRCLVRQLEKGKSLQGKGCELCVGNAAQRDTLQQAPEGCDAAIHLAAIITEKPRQAITFERINYQAAANMVDVCRARGVSRFLHMSALGADEKGATPYFRTKGRAEHYVRESGLNHTIFRPSFIYGPGDAVYTLLARMIERLPFGIFPLFGDGNYRHQPVSVFDVARGFVRACENSRTFSKTYDVGGPHSLSFRDQIATIARVIGKRIHLVRQPLNLSRFLVNLMSIFPFSPIDADRLTMLVRENVCDPGPFAEDLGIELKVFGENIEYLRH